jgi:hypothetical protein
VRQNTRSVVDILISGIRDISELDDIEEKIVRRLKKGSGKYQGKLPFKCFNCGKIGHFASKCPHKKKDQNSEGEEKYKSKRFGKKKSLCKQ